MEGAALLACFNPAQPITGFCEGWPYFSRSCTPDVLIVVGTARRQAPLRAGAEFRCHGLRADNKPDLVGRCIRALQ
jgi:hypothetical protein